MPVTILCSMVEDVPNEETRKIFERIKDKRITAEDAKSIQSKSRKAGGKSASMPVYKWDEDKDFDNRIKELDSKERIQEIKKKIAGEIEINIERWNSFGEELRLADKFEESIQAFNTVLIKDPKNRYALHRTGRAYQGLERWRDSIEFFDRVLKDDPNNRDSLIQAGYSKMQLKNYDDAIKYYQKVVDQNSRDANAINNLGYCFFKKNEFTIAIEWLSKILNMEDMDPSDTEFAKEYVSRCYFYEENYEKCNVVCDELIKKKTKDGYVYYMKGWMLSNNKKYEEAIVHLKNALKYEDKDVVWQSLGFCYKRLRKNDLSKMYYEKCLELWSENASALGNLSEIYYEEKNYDLGLEYGQKALKKVKDDPYFLEVVILNLFSLDRYEEVVLTIGEYQMQVGEDNMDEITFDYWCEAYWEIGKYEDCIRIAKKFQEKHPDGDGGLIWEATSLTRLSAKSSDPPKYGGEKALELFNQVITHRTKNNDVMLYDAYRLKSRELERHGKLSEALENIQSAHDELKKIGDRKPKEWVDEKLKLALLNKGILTKKIANQIDKQDRRGNEYENSMREAIEILDEAIELDPENAKAWSEKGRCYWNLKNYIKSEECGRKALEIDNSNEEYWLDVGDSLRVTDSIREAKVFLNKGLERDDSNPDIIACLAKCEYSLKNDEEALKLIEKAIAIGNGDWWSYFTKTLILSRMEREEESIKTAQKCIEEFPEDAGNKILYVNMSLDSSYLKNYDDAMTYANEALKLDPEYALAYHRIAFAYERQEQYSKAIEILEEHLDEFETDDEYIVFKRLVICYEKIGNREKAEDYMKKLEEIEEKD